MWVALTLDSAQQIEWHPNKRSIRGESQPHWMQNSRHWVEVFEDEWRFTQAIVHSLDSPEASQMVRLTGTASGLSLGVTTDNRLLAIYPEHQKRVREVPCFLMGLHSQVAVTQEFTISLPDPAHVIQMALSPQGDRLAWVLGSILDRENIRIWVSDLKGALMHEVASVPVLETRRGAHQEKVNLDWPRTLVWRMDGQELSFLYDGALWTVPAHAV